MDFMADHLGDGRAFRLLNILDDFNREGAGHRSRPFAAGRAGHPHPESVNEAARDFVTQGL
jgi:hypothetical protein